MDIKQLQYFVVSVDMGSFCSAAEVLITTQPNVSKVVKSLETELNMILLNRDRSGVTLTKEGEHVYNYAIEILKNMRMITNFRNGFHIETLSICSVPSNIISNILSQFYNKTSNNKEFKIDFIESKVEDIMKKVHRREAELGFIYISRKNISAFNRFIKNKGLKFYEMKNIARDMGIATPPSLQWLQAVLGWNAKAVDSIADRLEFRGFRDDNFDMTGIFRMNNPDILYDSATLSALISSCCFIYISKGEDDFPRLQVIDGANATGIINPITNLLTEGYAVLERDDYGKATVEAYFVEGWTVIYRNGIPDQLFEENVPAPLLVPIIFRPDAKRAFGHSRISRACMSITESAMRTLKRSEITAEFYSFPQKYVVGLDPDAEQMDKWKATVSSLLQFDKDEDGDSPTLGQFQQQSMAPHLDQLKMFAALFAGETGLTLDDLGFATENPASQEAIKASHENLRLTARKAQRAFGSGFLNAGYLAACLRDDYQYYRNQVYMTMPIWEPVFEPDAAMLSNIGDGAIKINQAVPGYFNADNLRDLTGINMSNLPVAPEV